MSTDAVNAATPPSSGDAPVAKIAPTEQQASQAGVPKKIVNAQTVCNERNEKGKLCNGHLKQLRTGGEEAEEHLRGDEVLFKCQTCGALYMGPPLGHVRDPRKQQRFVQKELTALLQAAGGTLPAFTRSATGAWVPAAEPAAHVPAANPASASAKTAATPAAKTAAPPTASEPDDETVEQKRARRIAEANARKATAIPIPGASGPVEGETPEQKIARLKAVVAEAKRRKEAAAAEGGDEVVLATTAPVPRTTPTAASTSGLDSSPSADAHRPAAEAQAATGQASAAPLSPAAATASPAAGAETVADLAPEASTELTPGAPKSAPPKSATSGKGIPPPPPHLAPPPGETKEEKIARLTRVVEEAKARAGK
jgi:hypothetical protein